MMDWLNQDMERVIELEARMTKKTKIEVLEKLSQQNLQEEVKPDSNDVRCSQQQSDIDKIYPSRVQSPLNSPQKGSKKKSDKKETPKKRKNKPITEYFDNSSKKQQKQKKILKTLPSPDSPIENLLHEKDKNLKEKMNQLSIAEIKYQEQLELNEQLRKNLEEFKNHHIKCRDVIKKLVIENEKLKRAEIRQFLSQNKQRLGDYCIQRDKGQLVDVWVEGIDIKNCKDRLKEVEQQRIELENKRKSRTDENDQMQLSAHLKKTLLQKEEQQLNDKLDVLEIEKALFIKILKRQIEQDHARFTKNDDWPVIGERYQILSLLGKGGFSEVYKAWDFDEMKEVACKIHQLNPDWSENAKQNYIKHAVRENYVHRSLNHPHIVKLYDSVEMDKASFCTVLELCDGQDLSIYMKRYKTIPEREAKMIITQVLSAIKYLNTHRNKVIHYDLKPQNILFHQNEVKISDFGLCKILEDDNSKLELTSQGVGTYYYLPPETFLTSDQPTLITSKVDIWAIGVILFEMLFGKKPFGDGLSQEKILKDKIILKSQQVLFPHSPIITNECKDFIRGCLNQNQFDRFDANQAFNHAFIGRKK